MELLVVTGKAGAGKTTAMNALEDCGFYCVDNLPPALIGQAVASARNGGIARMAVSVDSRAARLSDGSGSFAALFKAIDHPYKVLFLDCEDAILINRYKETRRLHPLQREGVGLGDAIKLDNELLSGVRGIADYRCDTSRLTAQALRGRITDIFARDAERLHISVVSFGFKYGVVPDADLMLDVRCVPNPHYVEKLRPLTGLNAAVRDYVFENGEAQGVLDRYLELLGYLIPLYIREGKTQLTIAVGCTGGRHRSVAIAEALGLSLTKAGYPNGVMHRDKDR